MRVNSSFQDGVQGAFGSHVVLVLLLINRGQRGPGLQAEYTLVCLHWNGPLECSVVYDITICLAICMELHGAAWSCMEPHGAAWSRMEPHGAAWSCMEPHGAAWSRMELHGAAWSRMELHGAAWSRMEPHGAA